MRSGVLKVAAIQAVSSALGLDHREAVKLKTCAKETV